MINLKAIFNQVYFFMIISELIILIATGLIYFFKADRVTQKALEQKRVLSIISRDSYIEYISKKMRIILEDELFILKTYLNIKDWDIKDISDFNNLKPAKEITDQGPWYLDSQNYTEYFRGQYNQKKDGTDICTKENLANFDKLSEFLGKLFEKYFSWKNKTYVNVEYLYMTLNTGCFYKFPAIKSGWAQDNYTIEDDPLICTNTEQEGRKSNFFNDPLPKDIYDPRCRPFYYSSIKSTDKISFTAPYKFSNGKWLSDICIRTDKKGAIPDEVLCMVINYFDLDVFRDETEEYKELTEVMILHYKNLNEASLYKNLNVLYDSSYFISEFNCYADDTNCVPINFFDVYYKNIIDKVFSSSSSNDEFLKKYEELKSHQSYVNLQNFIINIANEKTEELLKINIDNFKEDKVFYNQQSTAQISDGQITYIELDEKIYVFPILSSFDYDSGSFKLKKGTSENSEFFLIIRELSHSKNDEKTRFLRVAITEIFLFLFYILSFNTLIWFVFNIIYYYIIKGFTYSLKQIRKLYLLILSQVTNTGDEMIQKTSKLLNELGININTDSNDENENDKDDNNFLGSIYRFINEYIIKSIHNISQMENHKEIQQSFVTLKAIMIILVYNNSNHKNKGEKNSNININFNTDNKNGLEYDNNGIANNNNNNIKKEDSVENSKNQFISVIKFFSNCFYSQTSNKILIDYSLVKIVIENIFISMLQEFNSLKQEFVENPSRIFENLLEKLIQIDDFYFMTKQAILNSHKEIDIKLTYNRDSQDKNDLLLLSLLEENLNYLYSVHKCGLLDGLLSYKINENINMGENIDEEEKTLLEKLQKKEKKFGKKGIFDKIKNKSDDDNLNLEEKIKSNFSSIKLMEDFSCNEESKIYIKAIIKYCEDYLEIKDNNRKMIKKMNKNYNQNNYYSSSMNYFVTTVKTIDPFIKRKRVDEIISLFKIIFISLEISMYHILCEDGQKSFENFENALNKYHHFEKLIDSYKVKYKSEWKLTNFTMFFINSIFYERILVLFSFLCHKFSQYKTELFINLNILDFSPLYSLNTRRIIITKIMNYIYNLRKSLVQKSNDSIASYKSLIINNNYIDIQRSIYKLICLRNIISKDVKKKVLFLFDLNNKYIKDNVFKEIMFNYFKSYNEEIKSNNFEFFFCAFDNKLHLQFEPNFEDEIAKGKKYAKNYFTIINNEISNYTNKKQNVPDNNDNGSRLMSNFTLGKNLSMTSPKKANLNDSNSNNNSPHNNLDNLEEFFKFIKNYKGEKNGDLNSNLSNQEHRADKALYHSILFGFENNNDYSNINKFFRKNRYSKYTSSYLILMTNLSSTFTNNQNNWKEMEEIIYHKKVSVIVVISYDPSFDNNKILKEKISYYKNFLKTNMIDGYLFIMRSLTLLKFILNAIFPIKFSKFNIDILKHYLCSNEDINHSRPRNHAKNNF